MNVEQEIDCFFNVEDPLMLDINIEFCSMCPFVMKTICKYKTLYSNEHWEEFYCYVYGRTYIHPCGAKKPCFNPCISTHDRKVFKNVSLPKQWQMIIE